MTATPCSVALEQSQDWWTSTDPAERETAKWVCRKRCPFTLACARLAVETGAEDHVYAGFDCGKERERQRLRVEFERAMAARADRAS